MAQGRLALGWVPPWQPSTHLLLCLALHPLLPFPALLAALNLSAVLLERRWRQDVVEVDLAHAVRRMERQMPATKEWKQSSRRELQARGHTGAPKSNAATRHGKTSLSHPRKRTRCRTSRVTLKVERSRILADNVGGQQESRPNSCSTRSRRGRAVG